jgi:hypothetical protein
MAISASFKKKHSRFFSARIHDPADSFVSNNEGMNEVIAQNGPEIRHIYLNVTHSKDVKPSWYGESVGHYENGDTLVIDTIRISSKSFIDNYRTPHTDQLHVIERWKLAADGKTADVSVFVEDEGVFTTPGSATINLWAPTDG